MDLEIGTVGGSAGDRRLDPALTVHNTSLQPLVLRGAVLTTGAGSYSSASPPGGEAALAVAPGETKRVALRFELPGQVGEVLVDPVTLSLSFRVGDRTREISVPLTR